MAGLYSLLADNQKLVNTAWHYCRALDELLAARREILGAGPIQTDSRSPGAQQAPDSVQLFGPHPLQRNLPSFRFDRLVPTPDHNRCALLVVEDDTDDFVLLRRALEKLGNRARVDWAQNASDALRMLSELERWTRRICIVADVKLPGEDGFQLLRQVRQRSGLAPVRFAFLTGRPDPRTRALAKAAGADEFFAKPACSSDWIEIARALERLVADQHTAG